MSTESELDRLVEQGNVAADRGDHLLALSYFDRAISAGAAWVEHNRGNSLAELGLDEEAIGAFERAVAEGVQESELNLARALDRVGRNREARAIYARLIEVGDTKAMVSEAFELRHEGRLEEAEALMQRAAAGDGSDGEFAAGWLGIWRWAERSDPGAESLLRRGQHVSAEARATLAELLRATDREREAVDVWRAGSSAGEVDSMVPYANHLWESGEAGDAEAVFRRASEEGDVHATYNLSQLLQEQGRLVESSGYLWLAFDLGDELAAKEIRRRRES